MFLLAWAGTYQTHNLALWAKPSSWNFSWAFWPCCVMAKQWCCAALQVKSISGPLWAPLGYLERPQEGGASTALAPLAVKQTHLDESKHTLSCVWGSRVAEELPLPGGPRGTNTNPYTLKSTRRAARKQRPHFLLAGLRWPMCVLTPLNMSPDNWNDMHGSRGAIKSTWNGRSAHLFCIVNDSPMHTFFWTL